MNHNYRLEDFIIVENKDTHIYERIVSVDLSIIKELPLIIVRRLEILINNVIADYEKKHNVSIPITNSELGIYMEIDTWKHSLSLDTYVVYDYEKGCITGKEVITAADEHYSIIKKFFFGKLNEYVTEQIKKIEECVQ